MASLTIDLLTDGEKQRAFKMLRLISKIKTRKLDSFLTSLLFSMILLGAFVGVDKLLLAHNLSPLKAIELPLNSGYHAFILSLAGLMFACALAIPLYYAVFLPRARLRVLKLREFAWLQGDPDPLFPKLEKIRALADILSQDEIDKFSDPMLNKEKLDQFLASAITKIQCDI